MEDRNTYGFNRNDAEELLKSIGGSDGIDFTWRPTAKGGSTSLHHFILIEDVSGGTVQGRRCSPSGTGVDNNEDPTDLVNWAELLDGAKTGYVGLFAEVNDEWVLAQGPCIVPEEEPEE